VFGGLCGAAAGLAQWGVAHGRLKQSMLWILTSSAAWGAAWYVSALTFLALQPDDGYVEGVHLFFSPMSTVLYIFGEVLGPSAAYALEIAPLMAGLVGGALSGLALAYLLGWISVKTTRSAGEGPAVSSDC
jgi:hypothetical protein